MWKWETTIMISGSELGLQSQSHGTLAEIREAKNNGTISREKYWEKIRESSRNFDSIREIFSDKILSIEIMKGGILLTYAFTQGKHLKLSFDSEDLRSAPFVILADGAYEYFESQLILQILAQSRVFLDIGANIGIYTLMAVCSNPDIQVLSFEPNPEIASKLEKNLSINQLLGSSTARVICSALGDSKDTEGTLFVPSFTGSGGASLKNLHPEEESAKEIQIPISTIDRQTSDLHFVDLIKIDIEGYEFFAIRGGIETIRHYKPTIFIELLRKWMKPFGTNPQQVVEFLAIEGYECFAIGANQLFKISEINEETIENNFVFVHHSRKFESDLLLGYL